MCCTLLTSLTSFLILPNITQAYPNCLYKSLVNFRGMLMLYHSQHVLDEAFNLVLMADQYDLLYSKLVKHVPHLVQLLRGKPVSGLVQYEQVFCMNGSDDVVYHLIQRKVVCKRTACALPS